MHDTDLSAGAQFHERLASRWHQGYAGGSFRRRLDFIEARLAKVVLPGQCWLDVGCGAGTLTHALARMGARGDGIDGSPAMIDAARRLNDGGQAAAFAFHLVPTVESLQWPAASFDGVLCSSVLEYLDRPNEALAEIGRVLRPGGRLFLTAAQSHSAVRMTQALVRRAGAVFGRNLFEYLTVSRNTYTPGALRAAIEAAGLRIDAVERFDPLMPPWLMRAIPTSLLAVTATRAASR